jgi:hypothetical protein
VKVSNIRGREDLVPIEHIRADLVCFHGDAHRSKGEKQEPQLCPRRGVFERGQSREGRGERGEVASGAQQRARERGWQSTVGTPRVSEERW